MPTPRPMRRHRARSRLLPWRRRGYQTSGTASVRPSSSRTVSSSSVTLTSTALAARRSLVEVGIPAPQQRFSVLFNQSLNPSDLNRSKATAALEANRAQPELSAILISLDVNVRRLLRVARVKEDAVRAGPQHRRHRSTLPDVRAAMKSPELGLPTA